MILNEENIQKTTIEYYSCFCCTDLSKLEQGVHFICSTERNSILKGYGCKYSLYILLKGNLCVVAYSPAFQYFAETLKNRQPDGIIAVAENKYRFKKMRLLIFKKEKVLHSGNAKVLSIADYPFFEDFFRKTHPTANPTGGCQNILLKKQVKDIYPDISRMVGWFLFATHQICRIWKIKSNIPES